MQPYLKKIYLCNCTGAVIVWLCFLAFQAKFTFAAVLPLLFVTAISTVWGHSSAGRAPAWHAGGQEFESPWLHS